MALDRPRGIVSFKVPLNKSSLEFYPTFYSRESTVSIMMLQTRNKQYTPKKLSLPGDIIMYTLEALVMGKKYSTFSNLFYLLEDKPS